MSPKDTPAHTWDRKEIRPKEHRSFLTTEELAHDDCHTGRETFLE
jgi:hypothetical protein